MWFKKKKKEHDLKQTSLPGGIGTVEVPRSFEVEFEDDSTLAICPTDSRDIVIRISCLSFAKPNEDEEGAKEFVRKTAAAKGYKYRENDKSGIASYEQTSGEDGEPLLIKFWEHGCKNTVTVISATIVQQRLHSRAVQQTLGQIPPMVESLEITKSHRIIETDGEVVETTVETVDPTPQDFRPFGPSELAWLDENASVAQELSLAYGSGSLLDPEELDRVFSRWTLEEGEKEPPHVVANALGAAFGEYLVERHGFSWAVVTDAYGTEFAVTHPLGKTTAFPRASVEKRIENGQTEFFFHVYLMIADHLQRAKVDK